MTLREPCRSPEASGTAEVPAALAFEGFYRAHFDFVWRTLRRLGVQQSALDDAAQEVFLVVHRRFSDFDPETSAKAWLFAISQRVASDQRRTAQRKTNHLVPLSEHTSTSAGPFEGALQREAHDLVIAFLGTLDEARRAVFILSELEQMAAPEIARIVGANLNTVYYRIASSRRMFGDFVEKRHGKSAREGA